MSADRAQNGKRRERLLQFASAALFLTIVGVAVLIVLNAGQGSGGDADLEDVGAVNGSLAGIPQSGMTLGDRGAKVNLVEFGDLMCPACKAFSEAIIPEVIASKVRSGAATIAFRNFTIIAEGSTPAGAAAIAAGEQGRGWNFVELFYRNQGAETDDYVTDEFLTALARGAGVRDIARWQRERRSKAVLAEVSESTAEARDLGFTGTPSFAVEGPATEGLQPVDALESPQEQLEEAIDGAE